MTYFHEIMVTEKNIFSSNAWHSFAKGKVISKCTNNKPWKNLIGKLPAPPLLLRRPALHHKRGGGEGRGGPKYETTTLNKATIKKFFDGRLHCMFHEYIFDEYVVFSMAL